MNLKATFAERLSEQKTVETNEALLTSKHKTCNLARQPQLKVGRNDMTGFNFKSNNFTWFK